MLRAQAISKVYKDGKRNLEVLRGIELKINKGETVAIVGPSGAGKSTLLHILGGIDKPSSGKVFLDGRDFYTLSENKKARLRNQCIGFVFQFYYLLPEFNAIENTMLPGLIAGGLKAKGGRPAEKAKRILQELGLGDRLKHRPGELSGGEQQRVAIARAIINDPEVILCDEPTGNLDSEMGQDVLRILFDLNKKNNMAIVIVTHDKEIAKRAGRIIEIRDGRII